MDEYTHVFWQPGRFGSLVSLAPLPPALFLHTTFFCCWCFADVVALALFFSHTIGKRLDCRVSLSLTRYKRDQCKLRLDVAV